MDLTHRDTLLAELATLDDSMWKELGEQAVAVSDHAYIPASAFPVGAALLTAKGAVVGGCNAENGSYGLTVCAERTAVFSAVANEGPTMQIMRIAVYGTAFTTSPCGACRQVIAEFAGPDTPVLFVEEGHWKVHLLSDLLPIPFVFSRGK